MRLALDGRQLARPAAKPGPARENGSSTRLPETAIRETFAKREANSGFADRTRLRCVAYGGTNVTGYATSGRVGG